MRDGGGCSQPTGHIVAEYAANRFGNSWQPTFSPDVVRLQDEMLDRLTIPRGRRIGWDCICPGSAARRLVQWVNRVI